MDFEEHSGKVKSQNCVGEAKTIFGAAARNSNFFNWSGNSAFFSDFFPAAICLQRQHGCLPSKVRSTASEKVLLRKLPASIPVQATVCRIAQWLPVAVIKATINSKLPNRAGT